MWRLGIYTNSSCHKVCSFTCDHKNEVKKLNHGLSYNERIKTERCDKYVWISFESIKALELFYNIVAEFESSRICGDKNPSMYHKMCCDRFVQTGAGKFTYPLDVWSFEFIMGNNGVINVNGQRTCVKNKFNLYPQITFPRAHLPYVEKRLKIALSKKNK